MTQTTPSKKQVILFVWDGLRPDSLTDYKAHVPFLRTLAHAGIVFSDNHSAYPTFTMDNAQVFATGNYAGKTGFYGNVLYEPWRANKKEYSKAINARGQDITDSFQDPVFTEDYKILEDLNGKSVDGKADEPLVQVTTLLKEAHKKGLSTAVVGKSGPAFFQDYESGGIVLDENHVWPISFAQELQKNKIALPKNTPVEDSTGTLTLAPDNGDPSAPTKVVLLTDGSNISDPMHGIVSPFNQANEYMAHIFIHNILPEKKPDISVLWLRNPDTTEHIYGPGSPAYYSALESNDKILGDLMAQLKSMGTDKTTDIIIVSDHAHSNVLATKPNNKNGVPVLVTPLHSITADGKIGPKTNTKIVINQVNGEKQLITSGYPVAGTIRTADLITQAHLKTKEGKTILAFDGAGCSSNFGSSNMRKDDGQLDTKSDTYHPADGKCLGPKGENLPYSSPSYKVPRHFNDLKNSEVVVIGANGGSDYAYIPSHNPQVAQQLIHFFESREEYSAIFVDAVRYPNFDSFSKGTLPLSLIKLQNISGRNPDILVSMTANSQVVVNGLTGTEFDSESNFISRGTHGTFGKTDVHNTLLAFGPDFKSKSIDTLPTGNVDVAPTIAHLFQLNLPNTDGRFLREALINPNVNEKDFTIEPLVITSSQSCQLKIYEPTTHAIDFSKNNKNIDKSVDSFYTKIFARTLTFSNGEKVTYFDHAEGIREKGCTQYLSKK